MRLLALDWGEVRVGAAVSDESGKIAFALDHYFESKNAIDEIQKIIEELKIEKILIGNPKSLSGHESQSSEKVKVFVEKLKKQMIIPIEILDERFSTVEATKTLQSLGLSEKKQRTIKDNMAAQIILQQYLETRPLASERSDGGQANNS